MIAIGVAEMSKKIVAMKYKGREFYLEDIIPSRGGQKLKYMWSSTKQHATPGSEDRIKHFMEHCTCNKEWYLLDE